MYVDLSELRKRAEYISCREHETLDLLLWNYRASCQFGRAWDEYTRMTRGLITDSSGLVIARPFAKFFSVGETAETQIDRLPAERPEIREKLDGSMGVGFYDGDKVCVATRGSFTSKQAVWATNWMSKYQRQDFLKEYTYIYEIIHPGNRIVVDYGNNKELILLAVINTDDGSELNIDDEGMRLGLRTPDIINDDISVLSEVVKTLPIDAEGFVLRYPSGLRVKMKGRDYVRLHKAIFQMSTTVIWETLSVGGCFKDILDRLPEYYHQWIIDRKALIEKNFNALIEIPHKLRAEVNGLPTRKEKAVYIQQNYPEYAWMMSSILSNKNMTDKFWDAVKPEYIKMPTLGDTDDTILG